MVQYNTLGTVLLVDDHLPLLRNMAFLLEIVGFDTLTAASGTDALDLMNTCSPDLIISDIDMPGMDGFEFLRAVRADERWHGTPFIFTSTRYGLDDLLLSLDIGADDFVPKPFDIYDVLDAIQRAAPHLIHKPEKIAS